MINTPDSLLQDLDRLGVPRGATLMVHSSLSKIGWTVGGAATVVKALRNALGDDGTLVMPAESPGISDPADWDDPRVKDEWHDEIRKHLPLFDPATTPTTMGAIAEAFRTFPGTQRSNHPLVSVCANGPNADTIVANHPLEFCEGPGSPFETLFDVDAQTLLLGVGFDRCTSLHYAESLTPNRRTTTYRIPIELEGERKWVDTQQMASDNGTLFPLVGKQFTESGAVTVAVVGNAEAILFSTRDLVNFAHAYFEATLA